MCEMCEIFPLNCFRPAMLTKKYVDYNNMYELLTRTINKSFFFLHKNYDEVKFAVIVC